MKIPPLTASWDRFSRRDSHPSEKSALRPLSRGRPSTARRVASPRGAGSSWIKNSSRNTSRDVKDVSYGRVLCASTKPVAHDRHGPRKQVARAATLSLPPDGSFDDHDVCWERAKFLRESDAYKYAWIPQARLEDFREGLRKKTVDRSYFLESTEVVAQTERGNDDLPGRNVNTRDRWLRRETWHCECGPGSTQLTPDEMIASSKRAQAKRTRVSKIHTGGSKKVGCPACFVVRYPNPSCFQSVVPGGPSIDGFVRVAWKLVGHSAACDEVTQHASEPRPIRMIDELTRRNSKHSDTEIVEMYKRAVWSAFHARARAR